MKLKNVKFTGGVDGGGGWKGNVKNMLLDISKIKTLGWKPKHNTQQAIKKQPETTCQKNPHRQTSTTTKEYSKPAKLQFDLRKIRTIKECLKTVGGGRGM